MRLLHLTHHILEFILTCFIIHIQLLRSNFFFRHKLNHLFTLFFIFNLIYRFFHTYCTNIRRFSSFKILCFRFWWLSSSFFSSFNFSLLYIGHHVTQISITFLLFGSWVIFFLLALLIIIIFFKKIFHSFIIFVIFVWCFTSTLLPVFIRFLL